MPINNIVYLPYQPQPRTVGLRNFDDTLTLQLRVQDEGNYVVFGRVAITNSDGDPQAATARMTTAGGATELDRADVRIGGTGGADKMAIFLQARLHLPHAKESDFVEIRCSTYAGVAEEATLVAIAVDGFDTLA